MPGMQHSQDEEGSAGSTPRKGVSGDPAAVEPMAPAPDWLDVTAQEMENPVPV